MASESSPDSTDPPGLDPFVRRYLIGLAIVGLVVIVYALLPGDERLDAINAKLAAAPTLLDYPYRFRVLELHEGVAVVSSPRSADMGPLHFLRVLDPSLYGKSVTDPAMMAAQDALTVRQTEAARLVTEEADVERIEWVLDERWYAEHGIFLPE
ncbi:MAG: hypothetical protein AAGI24_11980 [Pseudomonadota bacterium]